MYTAQEDVVISPYQAERILKLNIVQEINEHAKLSLTAILIETEQDKPLFQTNAGGQVEIKSKNTDIGVIFKGMVEKIKVRHVQGVYYLDIEAVSNSKQMDIKKKMASYQDKAKTYSDIVSAITKTYLGGDVIDTASKGAALKKFTMQYEETDWEFIKRLASRFHAGLVPHVKQDKIQYFFGLPEGKDRGELKEYNYSVTKDITAYLKAKENNNPDLASIDRLYFEVQTGAFFDIGDKIKYQNKTLYVSKITTKLEQAVLKNTYWLTTEKGCSREEFFNDKIIGLSVQGKVLEVQKDQLKLHLCLDKSQDTGSAWLFPYTSLYTAEGNSGFYCMPEQGDTVYAYFPTKEESEGVGFQSIRTEGKGGDKISDPSVKYIRTKEGKELKLAPGEVLLTALDEQIYIKLNDKTGIEIQSTKPISVHTGEDLTVNAGKKLYLTAKEEINLTCKSSNILLDGSVTIQGKEVKNN